MKFSKELSVLCRMDEKLKKFTQTLQDILSLRIRKYLLVEELSEFLKQNSHFDPRKEFREIQDEFLFSYDNG